MGAPDWAGGSAVDGSPVVTGMVEKTERPARRLESIVRKNEVAMKSAAKATVALRKPDCWLDVEKSASPPPPPIKPEKPPLRPAWIKTIRITRTQTIT